MWRFLCLAALLLTLSIVSTARAQGQTNPIVSPGGTVSFASTGTEAPGSNMYSWDIVRTINGVVTVIATQFSPASWNVSFNTTTSQFTVTASTSATIAPNYKTRYHSGSNNYSALFDVVTLQPASLSLTPPSVAGGLSAT